MILEQELVIARAYWSKKILYHIIDYNSNQEIGSTGKLLCSGNFLSSLHDIKKLIEIEESLLPYMCKRCLNKIKK